LALGLHPEQKEIIVPAYRHFFFLSGGSLLFFLLPVFVLFPAPSNAELSGLFALAGICGFFQQSFLLLIGYGGGRGALLTTST